MGMHTCEPQDHCLSCFQTANSSTACLLTALWLTGASAFEAESIEQRPHESPSLMECGAMNVTRAICKAKTEKK